MAHSDLLWLDSDIILDWLAKRSPWDEAATQVIERAVLGDWQICYSPLTLANVHYIYRKYRGNAESLTAINLLARIGSVATMGSVHVRQALNMGRQDFEDELQIAAANAVAGITAIITRNLADYAHTSVPTMSAQDWLDHQSRLHESGK
jgi:predicted nucleic acid-binding protein